MSGLGERLGRIACLVSGQSRGSNFEAIVAACEDGRLPADVVLLLGTKEDCGAFERASRLGVPTRLLDLGQDLDAQIVAYCREATANILCLTGYLRKIGPLVIQAFPGKILNIHPALLPKFGGKGMYGMKVHHAVLEAGEKESGCTVHIVDEEYDHGKVLVQKRVPVFPGDTPESLAARVLEQEHLAYPEAIAGVLAIIQKEHHSS